MQINTSIQYYRAHQASINALAWSPDGRYIASASNDTTVHIWNALTGDLINTYKGHQQPVEAVSWSSKGMLIASGGWEKTIHVWHALTGERISMYSNHTAWIRNALAWSPDGQEIASGSWDRTVHIWQSLTGSTRLIYSGHTSVVKVIAWSPDGSRIASGGGSPQPVVQLWDTFQGRTLASYKGYTMSLRGLCWLPQKPEVLMGGLFENVRRWHPERDQGVKSYNDELGNAKNLQGENVVDDTYGFSNLTCSPDGHVLATALYQGGMSFWDVKTGKNRAVFFPSTSFQSVSWSPDGLHLACTETDRPVVQIWTVSGIDEQGEKSTS